MPSPPEPFRSVDELLRALDDPVAADEIVSGIAHHLQCAALLAQDAPDDVELQVAGLVHDVASSLVPRPAGDHAALGAALVRPLLGERVADLVGGHVDAKRYLVTVDPGYRALLSDDSTTTLALQGEELSPAELDAFEQSPMRDDWVTLRRADDRAKVVGAAVPGLDHWRSVLDQLASR